MLNGGEPVWKLTVGIILINSMANLIFFVHKGYCDIKAGQSLLFGIKITCVNKKSSKKLSAIKKKNKNINYRLKFLFVFHS